MGYAEASLVHTITNKDRHSVSVMATDLHLGQPSYSIRPVAYSFLQLSRMQAANVQKRTAVW